MNKNLLVIAGIALLGFWYLKNQKPAVSVPASTSNNPTGGKQIEAPTDLFSSILGSIKAATELAGTIAKTARENV